MSVFYILQLSLESLYPLFRMHNNLYSYYVCMYVLEKQFDHFYTKNFLFLIGSVFALNLALF